MNSEKKQLKRITDSSHFNLNHEIESLIRLTASSHPVFFITKRMQQITEKQRKCYFKIKKNEENIR